MYRGANYQSRVFAYAAVHALAEVAASPPFGLAAAPVRIHSEPQADVDDLHVHSSRGSAFIQAKRSVFLSTDPASPFGKAVAQLVREYSGDDFDEEKDVLVVAADDMSSPFTDHLRPMIQRLKTASDGTPLDELPTSQGQKQTLERFRVLLDAISKEGLGPELTEGEIRQLLARLQLVEVRFGEHGHGERQARSLLRQSILTDPDAAETAWSLLVDMGARLGELQAPISRRDLERRLREHGLQLKSVRSVEQDVEQLERWTDRTLERLRRFDRITIGDEEFSVHRPYAEKILSAGLEGNLAVTGEPGAGKTGSLVETVRLARDEAMPCVFLSADQLDVSTPGAIDPALGLEHRFPDVLQGWRGKEPGLLVVDGLDALRGTGGKRTLTQVLEEVTRHVEGWNVVVSIREYDLRQGNPFWKLFRGEPLSAPAPPLPDPELSDVRHIVISGFDDDELARAGQKSAALGRVLEGGPETLRALLRNPFNLDLAARLVESGVAPQNVAKIRSQTDLLQSWWNERVVRFGGGSAEERRHTLRNGLEVMIDSRRLRARRSAFLDTAASGEALTDLLSAHVLVEWQPLPSDPPDDSLITFEHHIVFDYAAARVLFGGMLTDVLEDDPGLVLFLRPSIELHFHRLWDRSTDRFWEAVLAVSSSDAIPQIGKTVGPTVASERVDLLEDLEPLLAALGTATDERRAGAANAFNHLAGALLWREDHSASDVRGIWPAVLERVSGSLSADVANRFLQLLRWALKHSRAGRSGGAAEQLGTAARAFLRYCWREDVTNPQMTAAAIRLVARTYDSDPASSLDLLKQVIAPERLTTRGGHELWPLAERVPDLWADNPEFVRAIYAAAFAYRDTSDESTQMGTPVMPLLSTRKQDFEMGQWKLKEEFSGFLEAAPVHATSAAISVVEEFAKDRWWSRVDDPEVHEFDFRGTEAQIAVDQSMTWGQGTARPDQYSLLIFQEFESHLCRLADSEDRTTMGEVLDVVAGEGRAAVVWARLLALGANKPQTIGRELAELLCAEPILTLTDTTGPACDLLEALHPVLDEEQRRRVEEAILSLGREGGAESDRRNRTLQRMVAHLDQTEIVTDRARRLSKEVAELENVPKREPPAKVTTYSQRWTEVDDLRDRGVDLEEPANAELKELMGPVKTFAGTDDAPTREEIDEVLPALRTLRRALHTAHDDGVHPELSSRSWGHLAAAVKRCAMSDSLDCTEDAFAFVKETALDAAKHEDPEPSEPSEGWESSPHWGSRVPRTEAAQALCYLTRHPTCSDDQALILAVQDLATDPSHVVRYQVARLVHWAMNTRAEATWGIVREMARGETSRGVLSGLLSEPLRHLSSKRPARGADLVATILGRIDAGPGSEKVRERCAALLGDVYVWHDIDRARQVVKEFTGNPGRYLVEAKTLAGHYRDILISDRDDGQPRSRAVGLLRELVRSARAEFERRLAGDGTPNATDEEELGDLMQILDSVGAALYFVSGASADQEQSEEDDLQPDESTQGRLYRETEAILDELAEVGIPKLAHHLVQTLEVFIPRDPRGVFLKLAAVIRGGGRGGYQYDPMAEEVIVELVERYLAEYGGLLQGDDECESALIEILDVFLVAGSTEAQRLTRRLGDIYR